MTIKYQVYKQSPGAIDVNGSSMDQGWYVVRMRDNTARGEPVPDGASVGPFNTKREAERNAKARGWKRSP